MGHVDPQKVVFTPYMLEGEMEHWWRGAKSLLESSGTKIIWEVFLTTLFDKYFLIVLRMKKKLNSYN